jgi:hypothetical protein
MRFERRLTLTGVALLMVAAAIWLPGRSPFGVPKAHAMPACVVGPNGQCMYLNYYGADLATGMQAATGVSTSNSYASNGPWPQRAGNYCFLASVQAVTNYAFWDQGSGIPYPTQSSQGPADDNPGDAVSGQILYDMDHYMVANFSPGQYIVGSGSTRRPFTLANTSHDSGGDPRAQAYGTWYETPTNHYYHQYIYHNGMNGAISGFAYALDAYKEPVIELINAGKHSVVVAGVWSWEDPINFFPASGYIDSFAVYNPWNQAWGSYLNGAYYSRVSYSDWTGTTYGGDFWYEHGYDWNSSTGTYQNSYNDPDPYMGIYQAGTDPVTGVRSSNPSSTHWVGNYVSIERDGHGDYNASYSYNESDQPMGGP